MTLLLLQVLKPACERQFSWDDKKLKTALASVLDMLHKSCVPPKAVKMDEEDNSCPLSAPAFSYCFPLIRAGLR